MELAFWDQFRRGTRNGSIPNGARVEQVPTMREYNRVLYDAEQYAGFSKEQARDIVSIAVFDQRRYGLRGSDLAPNVPGRIMSVRVPSTPPL